MPAEVTSSCGLDVVCHAVESFVSKPYDSRERPVLGVPVPLVSVDAMAASAASKVALALDRLGLRF